MPRQIRAIIPVLLIFFSCLTACITGCKSIDERYFERLDSLDEQLARTEELLEVDWSTIANRRDLVQEQLTLFQLYNTDSISLEFGNYLSKYKGVAKVYNRFLENVESVTKETGELLAQARDLRKAVEAGELSKDEFKRYYQAEYRDGEINLAAVERIVNPIHSVEPDYQRISKLMEEKLLQMAESNPALDSTLSGKKR